MTCAAIVLGILLQAVTPKSSIAGVVVNALTGDPVPNVRVSLARTNVPIPPILNALLGSEGAPPGDITLPGELLAALMLEAPPDVRAQVAAATASGGAPTINEADIKEVSISRNGMITLVTTSPVRTDVQGRFIFEGIDPGTYKVMMAANGYARQEHGQRIPGTPATQVDAAPGQTTTITARLVPTGTVAGRIRDTAGQPIAGATVQLQRFVYDANGQRSVLPTVTARTNDRGEYRLFFVSPGRYHLQASMRDATGSEAQAIAALLSLGSTSATANRIPEILPTTYYPGVTELGAAVLVEVQAGSDLQGMDFAMDKQRLYRVRGRVVDPRTGQHPPNMSLTLQPRSSGGELAALLAETTNRVGFNYNRQDGTFEFRDVSPGAYVIRGNVPVAAPPNAATLTPEQRAAIQQNRVGVNSAVTVASADVDLGVVSLAISATTQMEGRFRMDQGPIPAELTGRLRVQLRDPIGLGNTYSQGSASPDGSVRLPNVQTGDLRVTVPLLPTGYYLKEARLGDSDALAGPVRFSGPDSGTLDIVIGARVGRINGITRDDQGNAVSNTVVVAVPAARERIDLFKSAFADPSGRFEIPSLAPGDYKLFAWEALEPFLYFDAEFLRSVEDRGVPIQIGESSNQSVNATAIPFR